MIFFSEMVLAAVAVKNRARSPFTRDEEVLANVAYKEWNMLLLIGVFTLKGFVNKFACQSTSAPVWTGPKYLGSIAFCCARMLPFVILLSFLSGQGDFATGTWTGLGRIAGEVIKDKWNRKTKNCLPRPRHCGTVLRCDFSLSLSLSLSHTHTHTQLSIWIESFQMLVCCYSLLLCRPKQLRSHTLSPLHAEEKTEKDKHPSLWWAALMVFEIWTVFWKIDSPWCFTDLSFVFLKIATG